MATTVTINFTPCQPTPAGGYLVTYRPQGSTGEYRTWPDTFMTSPAIFTEDEDPPGTSYEGFIVGVCNGQQQGIPIAWSADNTGESASDSGGDESPSASGSEGDCEVEITYSFEETGGIGGQGVLIIRVNGSPEVTQSVNGGGTLIVQAGDEIECEVSGQTGTTRDVSYSDTMGPGDSDTSSSGNVSVTFTAQCLHEYEVIGSATV